MKAAVLYEPKTPLKIEELDLNEPGPGEVLVKLMASGVCHSDWHIVKGDWTYHVLPTVLGHEGAGWWSPWDTTCPASSLETT